MAQPAGLAAALLSPLGAIYGAVAARRMAQPGARAGIPVICVGNLTVGGAGKTPAAIAVAQLLIGGRRAAVLPQPRLWRTARRPGAGRSGSTRAAEVGDEPLLLARVAPTIVARDRVAGAQAARAAGASVIVMDDGFQNPSLHKDLSILVVDGRRGIGNGRVFPAGPLRAPLERAARARQRAAGGRRRRGRRRGDRGARARPAGVPRPRSSRMRRRSRRLRGSKVLAFAGIGDPEKFFATLARGRHRRRGAARLRRSSPLQRAPRRAR